MAGSLRAAINVAATGGAGGSDRGSKKGLTLGSVPLSVIEVKSRESFGRVFYPGLTEGEIRDDVGVKEVPAVWRRYVH
jgi:hypothetical protein